MKNSFRSRAGGASKEILPNDPVPAYLHIYLPGGFGLPTWSTRWSVGAKSAMATAWRNEMPRGTHASDAWHPPVGCITPLVTDHSPSVGSVVGDWTSTLWCLKKQWCDLRLQRRERGTTGKRGEGCRKRVVAAGPLALLNFKLWRARPKRFGRSGREGAPEGGSERASEAPGRTTRDFSKGFQTLRRNP